MSGQHEGGHHPDPEPFPALRAKALESLLVEKGLVSNDVVDSLVRAYEQDIGSLDGAQVVARAWVDPTYQQRLLQNGTDAIAELELGGSRGSEIIVLENTPKIYNMDVCTLCLCYHWPMLGLLPTWYKCSAYRSRAVIEPRSILREFGLHLDESAKVRVWGSTADLRYMVRPERPDETESLQEIELAALVTRDCMIGATKAQLPAELV